MIEWRKPSTVLATVRVGADSATIKENNKEEDQSSLAAAGGMIGVVGITFTILILGLYYAR
jgi:hypothetical protein